MQNDKKFELIAPYVPAGDQPEAIAGLIDGLQQKMLHQILLGVTGSGKTFTIANVIAQVQKPTLVLAPNKTLAAQLYDEIKSFFPHNAVEYFVSYYDYYQPEAYVPATDTFIEKDSAINDHIEQMRLSATRALIERRDVIVVGTVSAIYGLGDPNAYMTMVLQLRRGEQVDQRDVLRRLTELQYTRNDVAFERGTYRVQGDVIDIFPAESEDEAVRMVLFGEEIESLYYFDPLTGEIQRQAVRVTIYPKTHYVTPRERIVKMMDEIKAELRLQLDALYAENKLLEAQRLEQRTLFDLEMLNELGYCSGIENYSRYLSGRLPGEPPPTLMDYLPEDALVVVDESHVTIPQLGGMYRGDRSRKETLVKYGFRLPSALDNRPLQFHEFAGFEFPIIYVSATPAIYENEHAQRVVEQVVRPTGLIDPVVEVRPVKTQIDDVLDEIRLRLPLSERILVTTLTKKMAEQLTEYLAEKGIKVRYLHSDVDTVERMEIIRDLRLGRFDVLIGINLLREGLDIPEVSLVAILDADKEGFLRSERSLIQTMGRAARHINGKAILYADRITNSMRRAMDETDRRREKQIAFNTLYGITPTGVIKEIRDVLGSDSGNDVIDETPILSLRELTQLIKSKEKLMQQYARDLNFESAATIRDEIHALREQLKRI